MKLPILLLLSWGLTVTISAQRFPFVAPPVPKLVSVATLASNVHKAAENFKDGVENVMNLVQISPTGVNLNNIVDLIFSGLSMTIKAGGLDTVPLPDYQQRFVRKFNDDFTLDVGLQARRGFLKDLSTIRRTANTSLIRSGRNLTLSTGLGLNLLEFGYNRYKFHINNYHTKGLVVGRLGSNSAAVNLTIRVLSLMNCNVYLDDLKITGFDGLAMRMKGLGFFNQPVSAGLSYILRSVRNIFMSIAEERAITFLRKVLETYSCQNIINLLLHP